MSSIQIDPIGIIHSPYKEKFGIPRQPGLAAAQAELELLGDYANPDAVRGLDQCSHIWVMFVFSEHTERGWTPLVRPPRSQDGKVGSKMGVFATRSTFRPNPIGLSVVKLDGIDIRQGKARLRLSGVDILDGSPVIDIKPYLPYADSIADARNDYAPASELLNLPITFSERAEAVLQQQPDPSYLRQLISDVLNCDPRPNHQRQTADQHNPADEREYGIRLEDLNIRWQITTTAIVITSMTAYPAD